MGPVRSIPFNSMKLSSYMVVYVGASNFLSFSELNKAKVRRSKTTKTVRQAPNWVLYFSYPWKVSEIGLPYRSSCKHLFRTTYVVSCCLLLFELANLS